MIRGAIEKIQAPVNKAIDWLIGKAVKLAKAIGGLFGKKKKDEPEPAATDDPEHDAKVAVGLAELETVEQGKAEGGLKREEAEASAAAVVVAVVAEARVVSRAARDSADRAGDAVGSHTSCAAASASFVGRSRSLSSPRR